MKKVLGIIRVILPILITAVLGSVIIFRSGDYTEGLSKPPWYPPDWFFPAAWTLVFVLLGWGYRLFRSKTDNRLQGYGALTDTAAAFYYLQLFLNFFWVYLFFGLGFRWLAFIEGLMLIYFTGRMIFTVRRLNRTAALFMLPYIVQLLFGIIGLNLFIAVMN